jgi:hypothetical protein
MRVRIPGRWVSSAFHRVELACVCVTQRLHGIHPTSLLCCTDAWDLSRESDSRGILMMTRAAQLDVLLSAGSMALFTASNGSLPSQEAAALPLWRAIALKAERLQALELSLNDPELTVSATCTRALHSQNRSHGGGWFSGQ